jgi:raffinose/stachyose/melibiose transport system permease protein
MSATQVDNTLSRKAEGVVDPKNLKANKALKRKQNLPLLIFAGPAVFLYAVFFLFPGVNSLRLSVFDWNLFEYVPRQFNGIDNYVRLATDDIVFKTALGNNLELMLWVVIFQGGLSLLLALMLVKNTKTNVLLRAIYFFPTILSSVSVGLIWSFMFESNLGVINTALNKAGLSQFTANWLGDENIALYSIVITQVWFHTGQMMVIYVAGLQQIPAELYESAKIDGANSFQIFRKVTWPLIIPTGFVVIAYTTIQSFRAFDLIYTMTGGGPNYSTEILATRIYTLGLLEGRYGYAAAQSVFFMFTIALITILQRRLLRTRT